MISESISPQISISNPLVVADTFKTTISYIIKTEDSRGKYEVTRVYKHFTSMRKCLSKQWPGIYLPSIPSKSFLSNLSSKHVKTYRRQIDYFLSYISQYEFLYTSSDLQNFLKSKIYTSSTQHSSLEDTSLNFQAIFHEYSGKALSPEGKSALKEEKEFFEKSLSSLIDLRDRSEVLMSEFRDFHELLASSSKLLENIERNHIIEPGTHEIFVQTNLAGVKNHYSEMYAWAENEILEIEAMLEAIAFMDNLEKIEEKCFMTIQGLNDELAKVEANKMSIGRMFSFKSKDRFVEGVHEKIAGKEHELMNIKNLQNIVTIRLLEKDIPFFKQKRAEVFKSLRENYNGIIEKSIETFGESAKGTLRNINEYYT